MAQPDSINNLFENLKYYDRSFFTKGSDKHRPYSLIVNYPHYDVEIKLSKDYIRGMTELPLLEFKDKEGKELFSIYCTYLPTVSDWRKASYEIYVGNNRLERQESEKIKAHYKVNIVANELSNMLIKKVVDSNEAFLQSRREILFKSLSITDEDILRAEKSPTNHHQYVSDCLNYLRKTVDYSLCSPHKYKTMYERETSFGKVEVDYSKVNIHCHDNPSIGMILKNKNNEEICSFKAKIPKTGRLPGDKEVYLSDVSLGGTYFEYQETTKLLNIINIKKLMNEVFDGMKTAKVEAIEIQKQKEEERKKVIENALQPLENLPATPKKVEPVIESNIIAQENAKTTIVKENSDTTVISEGNPIIENEAVQHETVAQYQETSSSIISKIRKLKDRILPRKQVSHKPGA